MNIIKMPLPFNASAYPPYKVIGRGPMKRDCDSGSGRELAASRVVAVALALPVRHGTRITPWHTSKFIGKVAG